MLLLSILVESISLTVNGFICSYLAFGYIWVFFYTHLAINVPIPHELSCFIKQDPKSLVFEIYPFLVTLQLTLLSEQCSLPSSFTFKSALSLDTNYGGLDSLSLFVW